MTTDYKVRAVCYHTGPLPSSSNDLLSFLEECALKLQDISEALSEVLGCKPLSTRLTLARHKWGDRLPDVASRLADLADDYSITYAAAPLANTEPPVDAVASFLSASTKVFTSVVYRAEYADSIAKILYAIHKKCSNLFAFVQFAISYGPQPLSPYFPASSGDHRGFTVSLLYPTFLAEQLSSGASLTETLRSVAQRVEKAARIVAGKTEDRFLGIDMSLSPWREDSVVRVIEAVGKCRFPGPGSHYAIHVINKSITSLSRHVKLMGYNEVMLPLAEDDVLKESASKGILKFSTLLSYVPMCVAGLDMVPIPASTPMNVVKSVMRDLGAIHAIKRRPLGLRLILADSEAGGTVKIKLFGEVPVLSPLA